MIEVNPIRLYRDLFEWGPLVFLRKDGDIVTRGTDDGAVVPRAGQESIGVVIPDSNARYKRRVFVEEGFA